MATFHLLISTPRGIVFQGEAKSLQVPSMKGPLVIEPGYTNVVEGLQKAGILVVETEKGREFYAVFGGVVEFHKDAGCTLYSEEINWGKEIDMARALAARDRSLDRLHSDNPEIDIPRAKLKLWKSLIRINVKQLSEGQES